MSVCLLFLQACIDNNRKIIELLLERGADINVCDNEGWTPLHATASCGFIDLAQLVIDLIIRPFHL